MKEQTTVPDNVDIDSIFEAALSTHEAAMPARRDSFARTFFRPILISPRPSIS